VTSQPVHGRHLPAFLLLALAVLGRAHGREVARWLASSLPGGMDPDLPAVYRCLREMERRGWVVSQWVGARGPAVRTYALTPRGLSALKEQEAQVRASRDNLSFFLDQLQRLTSSWTKGEGTI
jgi:DNA-binding PadR family transcriptional regulator